MPRIRPAPLAACLLAAAAALAQDVRLQEVHQVLPPTVARAIAGERSADLDGDGLEDLVIDDLAWMRQPDDRFTLRADAFEAALGRPVAQVFRDLDGDGDLDRAVATGPWAGSAATFDTVQFNDGTGRFVNTAASQLPNSDGETRCIAAADIDGDGDVDLVTGRARVPSVPPQAARLFDVYVNDGTGQFTQENWRAPLLLDNTTNGLAFVDFDADGDLDLYLANDEFGGNSDRLCENDGTGTFQSVSWRQSGRDTVDVQACDFDLDGDVDLMLVDALASNPQQRFPRYLENTGSGLVEAVPAPPGAGVSSQLVLGDWNADGLPDYAIRAGCTVHAYVAVAPASFQPALLPPIFVPGCEPDVQALVALDYELDGDSDLVLPGAILAQDLALDSVLLRNVGSAWELAATDALPRRTSPGMVSRCCDLNGDGWPDLVRSPTTTVGGEVWLGAGPDRFVPAPGGAFAAARAIVRDMQFADFDGDGLLDVLCLHDSMLFQPSPPSTIYRNTGSSLQVLTSSLPYGWHAAAADFDGDGDVDLFVDAQFVDEVLLNDGSGNFTTLPNAVPPNGFLPYGYGRGLAAVDLDGDGAMDVAGHGSNLLRNNGAGVFSVQAVPNQPVATAIVADFDGDGDPDLFQPRTSSFLPSHLLLRNDGGWTFTIVPVAATPADYYGHFYAVDLDADGLADLVRQNGPGVQYGYAPSAVLRNAGNLTFVEVPDSVIGLPATRLRSACFFDVDGDRDVDMLLSDDRATSVYRNLTHQLAWRTLPRVGRALPLDVFGRTGEAFALGVAPTLLAAPLTIPGLGALQLDPGTLQVVGVGMLGPAGRFGFVVSVPNDASLVGLEIFAQALYPGLLGNLETVALRAH